MRRWISAPFGVLVGSKALVMEVLGATADRIKEAVNRGTDLTDRPAIAAFKMLPSQHFLKFRTVTDMDMADLACQAMSAAKELAIDDDAAADPGFEHQKQRHPGLAFRIPVTFPEGKCIRVILNHHWQVDMQRLAHQMLQVLRHPAQQGGHLHKANPVDLCRHSKTEAFDQLPGFFRQPCKGLRNGALDGKIGRDRPTIEGLNPAIRHLAPQVHPQRGDMLDANFRPNEPGCLGLQLQRDTRTSSSAWRTTVALVHEGNLPHQRGRKQLGDYIA